MFIPTRSRVMRTTTPRSLVTRTTTPRNRSPCPLLQATPPIPFTTQTQTPPTARRTRRPTPTWNGQSPSACRALSRTLRWPPPPPHPEAWRSPSSLTAIHNWVPQKKGGSQANAPGSCRVAPVLISTPFHRTRTVSQTRWRRRRSSWRELPSCRRRLATNPSPTARCAVTSPWPICTMGGSAATHAR